MPKYRTILIRNFLVDIIADDEKTAARLSELFVGYKDDSTEKDRKKYNFQIEDIEMIENDVIETSQVYDQ